MIRSFKTATAFVAVTGALTLLAGCGQSEAPVAETPAPEAPAAAPVVAAEHSPEQVILRGIECFRSLTNARGIAARLPADLASRIGDKPKASFAELTFVGGDLVPMSARRDAANSGRASPTSAQEITPEYLTYLEGCVAATDRVAALIAEEKAAKAARS